MRIRTSIRLGPLILLCGFVGQSCSQGVPAPADDFERANGGEVQSWTIRMQTGETISAGRISMTDSTLMIYELDRSNAAGRQLAATGDPPYIVKLNQVQSIERKPTGPGVTKSVVFGLSLVAMVPVVYWLTNDD